MFFFHGPSMRRHQNICHPERSMDLWGHQRPLPQPHGLSKKAFSLKAARDGRAPENQGTCLRTQLRSCAGVGEDGGLLKTYWSWTPVSSKGMNTNKKHTHFVSGLGGNFGWWMCVFFKSLLKKLVSNSSTCAIQD